MSTKNVYVFEGIFQIKGPHFTPDNVEKKSSQIFLSRDAGVEVCVVDGNFAPHEVRVDDLLVLVVERSVKSFPQELHDGEHFTVVGVDHRGKQDVVFTLVCFKIYFYLNSYLNDI